MHLINISRTRLATNKYLQHVVLLIVLTGLLSADIEIVPVKIMEPPSLDGKLNEQVWHQAPEIIGFKTLEPEFGKDAVEKTAAYVAHDDESLYLAIICYDSKPDKVKATVSNWDQLLMGQQDWAVDIQHKRCIIEVRRERASWRLGKFV